MDADLLKPEQIAIPAQSSRHRVIVAHDGELITSQTIADGSVNANGQAVSDADRDILKVVVYDRYHSSPPAVAFIRGFGLNEGALASSVAHDCHNIIAVGVSDEDIIQSMNTVIENKGGISFACNEEQFVLPLPVAGIMTAENGQSVADQYKNLDRRVKQHGSVLSAPYMTLSFMALLVIPSLKLSDQGLFDGEKFEFVNLFIKD
jgi:adenine deaminase